MNEHLYSYKNEEPKQLPLRFRTDSGQTRTSLHKLSKDELKSLGFVGPFAKPKIDPNFQRIEWTGFEYKVINFTEEEIIFIEKEKQIEEENRRRANIDYIEFLNRFFKCMIYKKIRSSAAQSLEISLIHIDFIRLSCDLKCNIINIEDIRKYFNIIFLVFDFSTEEVEEIQNILIKTNLDTIYTIPDQDYINKHHYDFETNIIVEKCKFNSWILKGGKWIPPVPFPSNQNKNYKWDEEIKNWKEI